MRWKSIPGALERTGAVRVHRERLSARVNGAAKARSSAREADQRRILCIVFNLASSIQSGFIF